MVARLQELPRQHQKELEAQKLKYDDALVQMISEAGNMNQLNYGSFLNSVCLSSHRHHSDSLKQRIAALTNENEALKKAAEAAQRKLQPPAKQDAHKPLQSARPSQQPSIPSGASQLSGTKRKKVADSVTGPTGKKAATIFGPQSMCHIP